MRQHSRLVSTTIEELTRAIPTALAIAQLHDAIRRSPAKNFWPVIRATRGALLLRPAGPGPECPWPWSLAKCGTLRYELPGHLLFSPWPPNLSRIVQSSLSTLQRLVDEIRTLSREHKYHLSSISHLPKFTWYRMLTARGAISATKWFQRLAMPNSIAALDTWSNDPQRGSPITLRILQGALVYNDGSERCEIEIPDTFTRPLRVPPMPENVQLHLVRTGGTRSYYP